MRRWYWRKEINTGVVAGWAVTDRLAGVQDVSRTGGQLQDAFRDKKYHSRGQRHESGRREEEDQKAEESTREARGFECWMPGQKRDKKDGAHASP